MKRPNKYIVYALIVSILYAVYIFTFSNPKYRAEPKTTYAVESVVQCLPSPDSLPKEKKRRSRAYEEWKGTTLVWGKDPFEYPESMQRARKRAPAGESGMNEARKEQKDTGKGEPFSSFEVTSILISKERRVATIDEEPYIVSIGDWIKKERVSDIRRDRILVIDPGKKEREIKLKTLDQ